MKKGARQLQPSGGNHTSRPVKSCPIRAHSRKTPAPVSPCPPVKTSGIGVNGTESDPIRPNPTLKTIFFSSGSPSPRPSQTKAQLIRAYPCPPVAPKSHEGGSVIQLGAKTKNYQTNPFWILVKHCVFSDLQKFPPFASSKTNPFLPATRRSAPNFSAGFRSSQQSRSFVLDRARSCPIVPKNLFCSLIFI